MVAITVLVAPFITDTVLESELVTKRVPTAAGPVVLSGCFIRERSFGLKFMVLQIVYLGIIKTTESATQDMKNKKGENWIFSFNDRTKQGNIIAYVVDSNDNTILEFNSGKGENNIKGFYYHLCSVLLIFAPEPFIIITFLKYNTTCK